MNRKARRTVWGLIAASSAIAAGMATRTALSASYRAVADDEPPRDPLEEDTEWGEALAWAAFTGAAMGISKVVVKSGARRGRRRLSGRRH